MNRRHFIYAASVGAASATMPLTTAAQGNRDPVSQMPQVGTKLRTITLEEHFVSPGFISGPGRGFIERLRTTGARGAKIFEQLQDVGDGRMAEMDAAGIDMQVLSLNAPGVEQAEVAEQVAIARESNDFLADVVKNNPRRFAAFASLPIAAPEQAADELDRRVRQQGFKGTLINGHTRGRYLDDKFFWPVLERAEALKVPIYLHPTVPPKPVADVLYGGFSPTVSAVFSAAGWGWHIETAVHLIRMVLGGAFDRYPKLQVVIGHLGEGVPFMMPRLNKNLPTETTKLARPLAAYLRENVHYTFSGFNFPATFLDLLLEVGVERIMFSADHPYGSMAEARVFLDHIPVSAADRERIAHGNAERLFNLQT
jgi:predicted TIM-barrel fold metal-dependent hydrolase